jgi:hypothetical protein
VIVSIGVTAAEIPQEFGRVSALDLLRVADHFLCVSKSREGVPGTTRRMSVALTFAIRRSSHFFGINFGHSGITEISLR